MKYIGLTGAIGSGKSTSAKLFAKLGAKMIDADALAKEAIKDESSSVPEIIKKHFSEAFSCLDEKLVLDRQKLAAVVFNDPAKLKQLNQILQPVINRLQIRELNRIFKTDPDAIVIYDAALLFEQDLAKFCQKVILIKTDFKTTCRRLKIARKLSIKQVAMIWNNQWPVELKAEKSDFIIENQSDLATLSDKINHIWKKVVDLSSVDFKYLIYNLSRRYE